MERFSPDLPVERLHERPPLEREREREREKEKGDVAKVRLPAAFGVAGFV
jgi:hypothetical protein